MGKTVNQLIVQVAVSNKTENFLHRCISIFFFFYNLIEFSIPLLHYNLEC
jgi:hypothetical protein